MEDIIMQIKIIQVQLFVVSLLNGAIVAIAWAFLKAIKKG